MLNLLILKRIRGGNTTKIHIAVDSYRLPIEFQLNGGEVHDAKPAPNLILTLPESAYVMASKRNGTLCAGLET